MCSYHNHIQYGMSRCDISKECNNVALSCGTGTNPSVCLSVAANTLTCFHNFLLNFSKVDICGCRMKLLFVKKKSYFDALILFDFNSFTINK